MAQEHSVFESRFLSGEVLPASCSSFFAGRCKDEGTADSNYHSKQRKPYFVILYNKNTSMLHLCPNIAVPMVSLSFNVRQHLFMFKINADMMCS
jgi:hypothetical protein